MIAPGSIKVMGRVPRTMRNFLRGISGSIDLDSVIEVSKMWPNRMYDLEVNAYYYPGSLPDGVKATLAVRCNFNVMDAFEDQEMVVSFGVGQGEGGSFRQLLFHWCISYGKPAGDDLLAIWPEAKNTLNRFLHQCYMLPPEQIIPYDAYTQAEVAEIGKQNLERMQKILGGSD